MQKPRPHFIRGWGRRSNPFGGYDLEAGAEFWRIVVMAGNLFQPMTDAQFLKLCFNSERLRRGEPLGEHRRRIARLRRDDLAAFDHQKAERPGIMAENVRADHVKRTARVKRAVGHEQPVIAEAVFEAPFMVPLVNRGEDLKRAHVSKLPRADGRTVQDRFPDRVAGLSLIDHLIIPRGSGRQQLRDSSGSAQPN